MHHCAAVCLCIKLSMMIFNFLYPDWLADGRKSTRIQFIIFFFITHSRLRKAMIKLTNYCKICATSIISKISIKPFIVTLVTSSTFDFFFIICYLSQAAQLFVKITQNQCMKICKKKIYTVVFVRFIFFLKMKHIFFFFLVSFTGKWNSFLIKRFFACYPFILLSLIN